MQRRVFALLSTFGLILVLSSSALAQYRLTNLSSNQAKAAKNDDPLNVNAWGMARGATSPWWISDQGSGWSTLYDENGVRQSLVVSVPPNAKGFVGQPTGIVINSSTEFQVNDFYFRHTRWHHQRLVTGGQSQERHCLSGQFHFRRLLHRSGNHQQSFR